MRSLIGSVLLGWLSLGPWCAPARADGGLLRLAGERGAYQISVFTTPTPFRAGPVDISVLVQNASTGDLVTQARVIVRMAKERRLALEYPATIEAATNKLFRAAQFELLEPGRWEMRVEVEGALGSAVIAGEIEAAEPLPPWRELWPWIGWPALAIVLFSIHQMLAQRPEAARRRRLSAGRNADRPVSHWSR
jgi:hypothetical protein